MRSAATSCILGAALVLMLGSAQAQEPAPRASGASQGAKSGTPTGQASSRAEHRGTEDAPFVIKILPSATGTQQPTPNPKPETHEHATDWWLVVPTCLLAVFTLGLFIYTAKLFGATNKLWKSAQDAEAPYLLPEVTRHIGFFQPLSVGRPQFHYMFRNHGKTPAIIGRWRDFTRFTDALPREPIFEEAWESRPEQYIPIGPGEAGGELFAQIPPGMTAEAVLDGLGADGHWLYIIGEVEYEDIFGVVRIQGYCLRIMRIQEDAFVVWRDGGRAYNQRQETASD